MHLLIQLGFKPCYFFLQFVFQLVLLQGLLLVFDHHGLQNFHAFAQRDDLTPVYLRLFIRFAAMWANTGP